MIVNATTIALHFPGKCGQIKPERKQMPGIFTANVSALVSHLFQCVNTLAAKAATQQ